MTIISWLKHFVCFWAPPGYIDMVKLLLEFGAKISFADPNPPDLFPRRDQPEEPLRLAIKNGHYTIAELLLEEGASPTTRYITWEYQPIGAVEDIIIK